MPKATAGKRPNLCLKPQNPCLPRPLCLKPRLKTNTPVR
jgi:hypothetical protein